MEFDTLPDEVKQFLYETKEVSILVREMFEDGFEGVYDSLEDWAKDLDCPVSDFESQPIDWPVVVDYIEVEGKFYCFKWV